MDEQNKKPPTLTQDEMNRLADLYVVRLRRQILEQCDGDKVVARWLLLQVLEQLEAEDIP